MPERYKAKKRSNKMNIYSNLQGKKNTKRKKKKKLFKAIKITFLLLIFALIVVVAGAFAIAYSYIKDTPEFNPGRLHPSLTSYIFDRHGNELASLYDEQNRIEIPLEEIPDHVQKAFIAIEDERFYNHIGIDPLAIVRAFVTNLRQRDWTEQGGSTITQQLIKNAFLTPEKTYRRKIQEAWLAIKMERQYSKSEILEMYLNQIYFAHGAYGIEAAANTYFNKSAKELSLAEAALLAGIPRSPNYYSPFLNYPASKQRQATVLSKMYELGFISHKEYLSAKEEEIILADPPSREYPFPYFVDYVLHHELINILTGLPEYNSREEAYEVIYNAGLRVYTTIDPKIQKIVEEVLNDERLYPQNIRVDMELLRKLLQNQDYTRYPEEVITEDGIPQPQSAAVVANPATGEVLALVGGREYSKNNQSLRFLSRRQPGSAIKPIVAYAPAMEENLITPGSIIDDAPFARGSWAPENFDRIFRGLVTVREALVRSLNVPAVKTFLQVTPELGLEYAKRMGITTIHPNDYNLATAIGGMTQGVTAYDMAQAYAVLANQGIKVNFHTVKRIEDPEGQIIYEHRSEPEAILSPQTAYLITDILKDVVRRGTAARLRVGRPVAAKTGTTSDNRDAYLVAYTPDIVVSFWMGHDIPKMGRIQGGSGATINFMNAILSRILEDLPPSDFGRPVGISGPIRICSKSGLRPGESCPEESIVSEIFPTALLPQETCNLHVELKICTESGLLPGEFCPESRIETRVFLNRPDYELTDLRWKGGAGRGPDDVSLMPPTEKCSLHTKPAPKPGGFTAYLQLNPLKIYLWWDGNPDFKEYHLLKRREKEDEFVLLEKLPGTVYQYQDSNVEAGIIYYYRLVAVSQEGVYSEPAEQYVYIPPATTGSDEIETEEEEDSIIDPDSRPIESPGEENKAKENNREKKRAGESP